MPLHSFISRRSTTQGHRTDLILIEIYCNIQSNNRLGFPVCILVLRYQSCDLFPSTYALIFCYIRLLAKSDRITLRIFRGFRISADGVNFELVSAIHTAFHFLFPLLELKMVLFYQFIESTCNLILTVSLVCLGVYYKKHVEVFKI